MVSLSLTKFICCCLVAAGMLALSAAGEAASPLTGTVKRIDGKEQDLAAYKGKVVLIVNVASQYGVTFDMFSKITVKGPSKAKLYETLTTAATPAGEVGWNFEKFLIGRDGEIIGRYKGKVVLIVNVASQCGYTRQYAGLQKLYDTYKDKGLVILGFPANDFGAQEPGTDLEIANFCSSQYGVTFDMFSKITVKGPNKAKLYETLTTAATPAGEVGWNFEKFLIGRDGEIIGRYKSGVAPEDPKLIAAIEAAVAQQQ